MWNHSQTPTIIDIGSRSPSKKKKKKKNNNVTTESKSNETKSKLSQLINMQHFPTTDDIALLQQCALNALPRTSEQEKTI